MIRDVWRKLEPKNMKYRRMVEAVISIHHTAGNPNATPEDVALVHNQRGWGHIGYHYLVYQNGDIYKTLPINVEPICVANQNHNMICIALVGSYENTPISENQIKSIQWLIHTLKMIYKIQKVGGHRDFAKATLCPGTTAYAMLKLRRVI